VGGQHPFSLADPAVAEDILATAGFAEIGFTDVHEPVYYGRDSATAYDFVLGLRDTRELLADLDAAATGHDTGGGGALFDSRAWIITATLPVRAS
jgi:hypothetical protein